MPPRSRSSAMPPATFVHAETRKAIARELVKDAGFKAGVAFAEAMLARPPKSRKKAKTSVHHKVK